jgi:hypothetical protein
MLLASAPKFATLDPVEEALRKSEGSLRSVRMRDAEDTDAVTGSVHWKPGKSVWITGMTLLALIGGPIYFTWGALALFFSRPPR